MSDVFQGDQGTNADELLAQLVGEGKKFKTVADLAKGKIESDQFIEQVKGENASLRNELSARDELIATLQKNAQPGNADPSKIAELVNQVLDTRTEAQKRRDNLDKSVATLEAELGTKEAVKQAIATKAAELGLSPEQLRVQAEASPVAFLTLMGVKAPANAPAVSKGGTVAPSAQPVRNAAYYSELRKTLGRKYYEPAIQNEIFEARKKLGPDFYR